MGKLLQLRPDRRSQDSRSVRCGASREPLSVSEARFVKYRLRIAKAEENELERLPLDIALQLEKHLQEMAELASETTGTGAEWVRQRDPQSGLLRFELGGFCILYEVDRESESVVVSSVKRVGSSTPPVAPGSG
jgi:mRNA-degrading endonuclease RelE of RelBE toxin-antitoxin system